MINESETPVNFYKVKAQKRKKRKRKKNYGISKKTPHIN